MSGMCVSVFLGLTETNMTKYAHLFVSGLYRSYYTHISNCIFYTHVFYIEFSIVQIFFTNTHTSMFACGCVIGFLWRTMQFFNAIGKNDKDKYISLHKDIQTKCWDKNKKKPVA